MLFKDIGTETTLGNSSSRKRQAATTSLTQHAACPQTHADSAKVASALQARLAHAQLPPHELRPQPRHGGGGEGRSFPKSA
jgi:hypothetical protein